ncbi:MAG: hypothetical protein WDN67_03950 [Candidatus Moraniibacteriota bacterium]
MSECISDRTSIFSPATSHRLRSGLWWDIACTAKSERYKARDQQIDGFPRGTFDGGHGLVVVSTDAPQEAATAIGQVIAEAPLRE